jgi:hypothetical protein
MVDIFSEDEKSGIKRPSDVYRLLQKKLKKKRESPYAILTEMEKYLAWFIPIISSVFFIFIGVSFKTDHSFALISNLLALAAFSLLFLSLVFSILSRFFIFHFNKLRSEFTIRIEEWGMSFFKLGERMMSKMETHAPKDPSRFNDLFIPDGPLQNEADEFMKLVSFGMLDTISKGLGERFEQANAKGQLEEIMAKEKERQLDFWAMRKGWGRWGIWFFYSSNVLFVASLISWFAYVVGEALRMRG